MSGKRIAIVGIGLRYPDAGSAAELWENVLAGRRAFRRLPDQRMNHADYFSPDPSAPDRFYTSKAAVLRDFEFDRVAYQVAGSTFRSTDMTHWLALDVAAQALADAGYPGGQGLPKASTGVVLGNSLTGEFTRANVLRLRWPYVRRTVAAALADKGWGEAEIAGFLPELEERYKAPFPAIDEDTLAGGLSNTIAGRICNHFDLGGGGYTVDGACSSSLLSVATAGTALADGEIDVALAGGVDLSIDPFEVVGFAKTGALATGEMKVYDRDSNGFWPGEGSGLLVLMREADAIARGSRIYATITGWGVSSDGKGGITRPAAGGHRRALDHAYARAGYGVETVSYFEGHGTGTAVGDATEIEALSAARRDADPDADPAALSTVKGNFGHTKAAAGVAGLIKAALAVHHQVIPPATGHYESHPSLRTDDAALFVPRQAVPWPAGRPVRAGVSALGFGGINTHVAVEQAPTAARREELDDRTVGLVAGRQDAELLVIDAADFAGLGSRLAELADLVPALAYAELTDLAAALAAEASGGPVRAAIVAGSPDEAARKITRLRTALDGGTTELLAASDGVFLARRSAAPRIAFLFPGQGSGNGAVGALRRRFAAADEIFQAAGLPTTGDQVATEVAQPRIVTGSLAGLRVLTDLGVQAHVGLGHSLGELTALHWGGALDADQVRGLAAERGRIMATAGEGGGSMAGLTAGPEVAQRLIADSPVVIAGYNGPHQTVVSGPAAAVAEVCERAGRQGIETASLRVSHAFHSPLVEPAAAAFADRLAGFGFARLDRTVVSTVTGAELDAGTDLRGLLRDQVVRPVRFHEAATTAGTGSDLVVEVGPGRVLTGMLREIAPDVPALALDTDNQSLNPLLGVLGAAFALGAPVRVEALFTGRVVRPLPLDGSMTFLTSPCESAPELGADLSAIDAPAAQAAPETAEPTGESTFELLRRLAADRVELPLETVGEQTHPLDDLHLSSITVGQIVNEATRMLGQQPLEATTGFATATLGELARMIDDLAGSERSADGSGGEAPGVAAWVRPFAVEHVEQPLPDAGVQAGDGGEWEVFATSGHPLAEPLRAALSRNGLGGGALLCLPEECGADEVELFLDAARAAVAGSRFVVVQNRYGASGLARTVHLESPETSTTVVALATVEPTGPAEVANAVDLVVAEVAATTGYSEVRYDGDGTRTVPALRLVTPQQQDAAALDGDDVLLVTGGGKGITAECALAVATDSGARLALLGRADPAEDAELAANLSRMDAAGVRFHYERADVTSPEQVRAAVGRLVAELGPVTAVLHGAGRNNPATVANLTPSEFRNTVAPKVAGLRAVLGAIDPERLKLLVTFGSIIGRAGLRGEAHYATANDWMTELTTEFQRHHPHVRALALEWSVWSGAGMGERLGVVESLLREGIAPISTEDGVALLRQVLADPRTPPVLVVSGRAGALPTLSWPRAELPLTRFVDRVLVHYPGVELVTEADLSAGSDPYLDDHLLDGDLLFPAVLGMEAMTQVANAVVDRPGVPLLEDVEFLRPVVVQPGGATTIRIAALATGPGAVDVVIRSAETGFGADHFRARLRFPRPELVRATRPAAIELPMVPVDPVGELYGGLLFQGKRFQRLLGYRRAAARNAVAELSTESPSPWFAPYLAQERLLADPGTRDAVMHGLQCCVPDATLLPERIEKLHLADRGAQDADYVVIDARERGQDGDSYTYDVDVLDPAGELVERWEGLVLRAVRKRDGAGPWVPAMLSAHLERSLERVLGGSRAVVVEPDSAAEPDRRARTGLALSRALGRPVRIRYRPDGKPEVEGAAVSASHGAGLTLAVAGDGRLGCDVEVAAQRTEEDWAGLLGREQLAVRDLLVASGESPSVAGTRVWTALECLRKAGAATQSLALDPVRPDGWAVLSAGGTAVATFATALAGRTDPVVFAVLGEKEVR